MLIVMNGQTRHRKPSVNRKVSDPRRTVVLIFAVSLMIGSGLMWWLGESGSGTFAYAAMGRIGLVMGALWLAWPSLHRPAQWLPPGIAVLGVGALGVMAANPRLVIVVVPALSALIALAAVLRSIRRNP